MRVVGGPTDDPDLPSEKPLESNWTFSFFRVTESPLFCNLFVSQFTTIGWRMPTSQLVMESGNASAGVKLSKPKGRTKPPRHRLTWRRTLFCKDNAEISCNHKTRIGSGACKCHLCTWLNEHVQYMSTKQRHFKPIQWTTGAAEIAQSTYLAMSIKSMANSKWEISISKISAQQRRCS